MATITDFVPDQALRAHVEFTGPLHGIDARVLGRSFDLTFRFEQVPVGTRIFRGLELQPVALIRPLLPLLMRAMAVRNRYLLVNLKRAIEGQA